MHYSISINANDSWEGRWVLEENLLQGSSFLYKRLGLNMGHFGLYAAIKVFRLSTNIRSPACDTSHTK